MSNRYVHVPEFVAIHDTESDRYYPVLSNKTAALFTTEFNTDPEGYWDILENTDDWLTLEQVEAQGPHESDDVVWDAYQPVVERILDARTTLPEVAS